MPFFKKSKQDLIKKTHLCNQSIKTHTVDFAIYKIAKKDRETFPIIGENTVVRNH